MGDNKLARSETNYRTNTNTGMKCVLCNGEARTYCESDDATLCWDCDSRVHTANFLVARHSRALLCRSCHRPTAWKASGERLPPTVSLCPQCCFETESESNDDNDEGEECETDETQEEEEEATAMEEEGDNQVVPWGMIGPPGVSDGSSSEGSTSKRDGIDQSDLRQMDEEPSSLQINEKTDGGDEATSSKEGPFFWLAKARTKSSRRVKK